MLLQYKEQLLKRRHPDYRPLSLDWNHKLLPRSASVCLVCESEYECAYMYEALQTWIEHKMASCFPSPPNVPSGASIIMTGTVRPVSSHSSRLLSFLLPSTLLLLFFCWSSVCSTHALPASPPARLYALHPLSPSGFSDMPPMLDSSLVNMIYRVMKGLWRCSERICL